MTTQCNIRALTIAKPMRTSKTGETKMYTVQEYVGNKWFTIARFATEAEAAKFAKKHSRKARVSFERIIAK